MLPLQEGSPKGHLQLGANTLARRKNRLNATYAEQEGDCMPSKTTSANRRILWATNTNLRPRSRGGGGVGNGISPLKTPKS